VVPEEPQVVQPGVPAVVRGDPHSAAVADRWEHLPEQSMPEAVSSPVVERRPQAVHPQTSRPGPSS